MAADFIGPVIEWAKGVLESDALGELLDEVKLKRFAQVKKSFTGVVTNWPAAAVMGQTTDFDSEATATHENHSITIKFGVSGADSDQVMADAMRYMKAIDQAIGGAAWLPQMARVFVAQHDYGPLYEKSGSFARFPEMHIEVEVYEA